MQCVPTAIPEVLLLTPARYHDDRGFFTELYHAGRYAQHGMTRPFVQDNFSHSCRHTLRGMHYQRRQPQAKLISVIRGAIFDVAIDIRRGAPTFGRWVGQVLSDANHHQLFVPEGFAHGFLVLSDEADVLYKCTDLYAPNDDYGILWSDPAIGITWPEANPLLSPKDARQPCLRDVAEADLPTYP